MYISEKSEDITPESNFGAFDVTVKVHLGVCFFIIAEMLHRGEPEGPHPNPSRVLARTVGKSKAKASMEDTFAFMVRPAGFEPAVFAFGGRYSIH